MKKYIRPDVDIVTFEVEDIITVSGLIVNKSELEGKDLDIYTAYTKNSNVDNNNVSIFTALDTVRVLLDVLEETTLGISTIDA